MIMLKNKKAEILLVLSLSFFAGFGMVFFGTEQTNAISPICQKSKACREAAAKEQEANKAAADAASTANAYQNKVNETTAEIATKEAEIANSEAEVEQLKSKIKKTEEEILNDQEALAELLVKMHFESDAEPIKILAGASSISDLAEKAAREEVVREQINTQATKIKRQKDELESNRASVEEQLSQQQNKRKELISKKKEREDLVAKYQNDADAYEEVAAAAREERQAAERAWQEQHSNSFSGFASSYTGINTYPWQAECPQKQDYYTTSIGGYKIGGYVCECVSYAGWKAYEAWGIPLGWGNAYSWDDGARQDGRFSVDRTPTAGSIGQMDSGPYGHVFWVETVNSDGSIDVTEYNNYYATYLYSGSKHYGDFGARNIPANEVGNYNYIHLR